MTKELVTLIMAGMAVVAVPSTFATSAQEKLQPITVCEVLSNPKAYNGKTIAVVGWLGGTDEGSWLDEVDCGRELQTDGFTWPNSLSLEHQASAPLMARA
jgi:hypothetical protein